MKHSINLFFKKLLILVIILIAADQLFGLVFKPIFDRQQNGKFFTTTYAIQKGKEDIVIIGSSHANQHFNATMMVQKLKVSVFNYGNQGQSILYYYPLIKSILLRYKPKLVILNLELNELMYSPDYYNKLSIFLPYKGTNNYIDSAILLADKLNRYKGISNLYRYNSTMGYTLLSLMSKSYNKSIYSLGYDPQYGNICGKTESNHLVNSGNEPEFRSDSLKERYLLNLIDGLKKQNVQLIVTSSPVFKANFYTNNQLKKYHDILTYLLSINNVTYLDLSNDPRFINSCELFFDKDHLNSNGADIFTNLVIEFILNNHFLK